MQGLAGLRATGSSGHGSAGPGLRGRRQPQAQNQMGAVPAGPEAIRPITPSNALPPPHPGGGVSQDFSEIGRFREP